VLDLAPSQEIIWLHEELFPDSRAYNFTASLDLTGTLDVAALHGGLVAVLNRHDALRLELVPGAFPPRQRVNPSCEPRFRIVDLTSAPDQDTAFERLWREQHDEHFDTARAPMVRWTLIRLGPDRHRLLHTEHHLVHDGWSFALVLRDLFTFYRELAHDVPATLPPPGTYINYVAQATALRAHLETTRQAVAYWRSALDGAAFDLPLAGRSQPRRVRPSLDGGQLRTTLGPQSAHRLREAARRDGHTPFSVLLTLFAETLRRSTGRTDMVLGTAIGNRPPGFEETVGMFVNTLPLRLRLDPRARAVDAVDDNTETLIRSLAHRSVPIQDLAKGLGVHSSSGLDNPLFHAMFSAHDAPLPSIDGLGLDVTIYEAYNTGSSRFDLDVVLIPDARRTVNPHTAPSGMLVLWDYAADLFDPPAVRILHDRLGQLLDAYLDNNTATLDDLITSADGDCVSRP
jgi:hypothetical protein